MSVTATAKPLRECTIALVSTAGIARNDAQPFDQERERRNPWWGDPSYRVIPLGTSEQDVRIYHLHIDRNHPPRRATRPGISRRRPSSSC